MRARLALLVFKAYPFSILMSSLDICQTTKDFSLSLSFSFFFCSFCLSISLFLSFFIFFSTRRNSPFPLLTMWASPPEPTSETQLKWASTLRSLLKSVTVLSLFLEPVDHNTKTQKHTKRKCNNGLYVCMHACVFFIPSG